MTIVKHPRGTLLYIFKLLWYLTVSENQRDPQYKLRWSEELRDKIAQSAKEHNRSMNADIVARLEQSFDAQNHDEIIGKIPTENLMMELSYRFKGFTIAVMEKQDDKKSP